MPALQVKDFPPDLYEDLRACAAQQDRSISQQTVRILREYLRAYRQVGERATWEARVVELPERQAPQDVSASAVMCLSGELAEAEGTGARMERRRKTLEKIRSLPKIEVPSDFPDAAELVRCMREERDARLDFSSELAAWEAQR